MKYFISFVLGFGLVIAITVVITAYVNSRLVSLDHQCKQRFGRDYSYTIGIATDCIDSKGNGKFLKEQQ